MPVLTLNYYWHILTQLVFTGKQLKVVWSLKIAHNEQNKLFLDHWTKKQIKRVSKVCSFQEDSCMNRINFKIVVLFVLICIKKDHNFERNEIRSTVFLK